MLRKDYPDAIHSDKDFTSLSTDRETVGLEKTLLNSDEIIVKQNILY